MGMVNSDPLSVLTIRLITIAFCGTETLKMRLLTGRPWISQVAVFMLIWVDRLMAAALPHQSIRPEHGPISYTGSCIIQSNTATITPTYTITETGIITSTSTISPTYSNTSTLTITPTLTLTSTSVTSPTFTVTPTLTIT